MNCDINEIKKLDLFHGIKESDLPGMMSCIGGQIKTYDKGQFISLEADEMNVFMLCSPAPCTCSSSIYGETKRSFQ